ncbi:MAG: hypothetical protein RLZZ495_1031 [Pseudomonadota bacterium]|jgi:hypothetical protein
MTKHLQHLILRFPLLVTAVAVSLLGFSAQAAPKKTAAPKTNNSMRAIHNAPPPTVRITPRIRYEMLPDSALPTLKAKDIEAFLAEMVVLDEVGLSRAPRVVSTIDGRRMISKGDRAYARGSSDSPLLDSQTQDQVFRVFRNAVPLKDPISNEILGYEAQYLGKAILVRGEDSNETEVIPATIDILSTKEEIRVGDRLMTEPRGVLQTYHPHPPYEKMEARVVSLYGNAGVSASQNQIVALNLGAADGVDPGLLLAIQKDGMRITDTTEDGNNVPMKLPDERNGLLMVFRVFERVSYALVLQITDQVRVGDKLVSPNQ